MIFRRAKVADSKGAPSISNPLDLQRFPVSAFSSPVFP